MAQCRNNLKQLGIAFHNYHDNFTCLPSGWIGVDLASGEPDPYGTTGFGWGAMLLPYIEQAPLYNQFDFGKTINDYSTTPINNQSLLATKLSSFTCPSERDDGNWTVTHAYTQQNIALVASCNYIGVYGTQDYFCGPIGTSCVGQGPLYHNSRVRIGEIQDGTSHSIILLERRNDALNSWYGNSVRGTWAGAIPEAVDVLEVFSSEIDEGPNGVIEDEDLGSYHSSACNFLFCDGHVQSIQTGIDINILKALATISGAESTGEF